MGYKNINFDITQGIAVITLNRPEQLNTFSADMLAELSSLYRHCDDSDEVRVVIITGKGKAFCAGADLSADSKAFDAKAHDNFSSCPSSMQPWEIRKPVIAACNGHAIGVGLTLALQCDLRIFAKQGKYALQQTRLGVVADNAVEYLLPRLVGFERAFELLVRGNRLNGEEAVEWGLASRSLPADEVLSGAMEIAQDMVTNCSPTVMAMHKRLLWRGLDMSLQNFVELETQALRHSMQHSDAVEGSTAWMEKRPPRWSSEINQRWPDFL